MRRKDRVGPAPSGGGGGDAKACVQAAGRGGERSSGREEPRVLC